jgi:hypothetical protein
MARRARLALGLGQGCHKHVSSGLYIDALLLAYVCSCQSSPRLVCLTKVILLIFIRTREPVLTSQQS